MEQETNNDFPNNWKKALETKSINQEHLDSLNRGSPELKSGLLSACPTWKTLFTELDIKINLIGQFFFDSQNQNS